MLGCRPDPEEGKDPGEEHGVVAAAQDRVIWKMS